MSPLISSAEAKTIEMSRSPRMRCGEVIVTLGEMAAYSGVNIGVRFGIGRDGIYDDGVRLYTLRPLLGRKVLVKAAEQLEEIEGINAKFEEFFEEEDTEEIDGIIIYKPIGE